MTPLAELVGRLPAVRARSIARSVGPFLEERGGPPSAHRLEAAALTVLAAVYREGGPLREELLAERARFERLVRLVHRAGHRRGGEP